VAETGDDGGRVGHTPVKILRGWAHEVGGRHAQNTPVYIGSVSIYYKLPTYRDLPFLTDDLDVDSVILIGSSGRLTSVSTNTVLRRQRFCPNSDRLRRARVFGGVTR
jgi:hypothetical protein